MSKCICDVCKTENELDYEYCKNCGAKLNREENNDSFNASTPQQDNGAYTPVSPYTSNQQSGHYTAHNQYQNRLYERKTALSFEKSYGITEIDGVKTEDLAAYIGPNNKKIINKFSRMELTGSKVSWCWPAALWGLLGLCGVAMWFIYRKMYKLGIILLAVGILLDGAIAYIGGSGINSFDNFVNEFFTESYSGSDVDVLEEIPEIEQGNSEKRKFRTSLALLLGDVVFLSGITFGGVFGMYIYKKHTIKKIKHYNLVNVSERYHQIGLMAVGGTSAGFAVLAFFVSGFVAEIFNRILFTIV